MNLKSILLCANLRKVEKMKNLVEQFEGIYEHVSLKLHPLRTMMLMEGNEWLAVSTMLFSYFEMGFDLSDTFKVYGSHHQTLITYCGRD